MYLSIENWELAVSDEYLQRLRSRTINHLGTLKWIINQGHIYDKYFSLYLWKAATT